MNSEYVEFQKSFQTYFDVKLKEECKEHEEVRKKYLLRFFVCFVAFVLLTVALWVKLYRYGFRYFFSDDVFGIICVFYFLVAYLVCYFPFICYQRETKRPVLNKILNFLGELKCGREWLIARHRIDASMLFCRCSEIYTDDTFYGECDGVDVAVSEHELECGYCGRGAGVRLKSFKGVLILLGMKKTFAGKTAVFCDDTLASRSFFVYFPWVCGVLGVLLGIAWDLGYFDFVSGVEVWAVVPAFLRPCFDFEVGVFVSVFLIVFALAGIILWSVPNRARKEHVWEQVNMEDTGIGKRWSVYSTNSAEARCLLTPALLKGMLELKKRFYGNKIEFSFF